MAKANVAFVSFNRGLVSRLGLARGDVKRIAMSAEVMTNWKPRVLGSMMIRPGTGYLFGTQGNNPARYLAFIYAINDVALIELTALIMRVVINDVLLTRVAVGSAVTNGTFAGNIAGWTDGSDVGATPPAYALVAGVNTLQLASNGTARSIAYQNVVVAVADQGKEHALRIVVNNGPISLKIGTAVGDDSYVNQTTIDTGTHSIAFTPTGAQITVQFASTLIRTTRVSNCTIEGAGIVTLPTQWTLADLGNLRSGPDQQSGDVLWVFCSGFQQRKIERRGTHPNARSWSIVLFRPDDGPFLIENTGPTTLTPSVLNGNGTLTASMPLFRATHVGALFSHTSIGQFVNKLIAALNDATNSIRVTGAGSDRSFTIAITGMTAGRTIILQRSFDNAAWVAVAGKTWGADTIEGYIDALDNQTIYYRLICTVVGAAGSTAVSLAIAIGSVRGIARVTSYTSNLVVNVEVITDFGGLTASATWEEGQWSDFRGWPSSGAFYEGRLWNAGKSSIVGSESDAFASYPDDIDGSLADSGPINRTIGSGPVDVINWVLPVQRLILGAQGAEHSARSSSLDEPLTPTNFNIKPASTQGSAPVQALRIDKNGIYVQRGGTRVFMLEFELQSYDYGSIHLSAIVPEIGSPGIIRMAAQRQIDTVAHFVRSDGVVACLLFDKVENVTCWYLTESDGASGVIEDVCVLPGSSSAEEDQVYYVVNRLINGVTVRYLEKMALESECLGNAAVCKLADAHVVYQGGFATNVPAGFASHLEGQQVVVWADTADVGTATDSSGNRTLIYTIVGGKLSPDLPTPAANIVIGLYYEAPWESAKLVELKTELGSALTEQKQIFGLGLIMADVHAKGLRYGRDLTDITTMQDLPGIEDGAPVGANDVRVSYDNPTIEFPGDWTTDERLCLLASAPRPVTILCATCDTESHA